VSTHRPLTAAEIRVLEAAGCRAAAWSGVEVKEGFDPHRVRRVHFAGRVRLGALRGHVRLEDAVELPAEIADATLVDCTLGDGVRVCNVGGYLARYAVGDGAAIVDVGTLSTRPGATFGNGVEVNVLNEGGGREVPIFAEMSSHFAYLCALHRYRPRLIERLRALAEAGVAEKRADRGYIGTGARLLHVGEIRDVHIGDHASVCNALRLGNGTLLSEEIAPSHIGAGVVAQDFVVGEGSIVEDGVVLSRTFVGQGVRLGKQFSAENCLFFANCEGFHGEAVSVFAGPYTVTHHKSTLLIAGQYSFYNAGSGTNQSNHMYKLGPVHQGRLERGSKTGSASYLLWPTVVGPFSVVIGKHLNNFDTSDLPFSYLFEEGGQTHLVPTMNMHTVGTVRDGDKWPARDRRQGSVRRDLIHFEVYSPYLVGKMLRGEAVLRQLADAVPRDVEQVRYQGVLIKRLLLRTGAKGYRNAIDLYLQTKVLERVAPVLSEGIQAARRALAAPQGAVHSEDWADVGGLLMARDRLQALEEAIESGQIATLAALQQAFQQAWEAYSADEWAWVRQTFHNRTGKSVDQLTLEELKELEVAHCQARTTVLKKVLADAEKEFDESARIGFGADGGHGEQVADFAAVRGHFADNSFVRQLKEDVRLAHRPA
jgi:hypothetical protein